MKKHANIPIFIPHLGCPNQCVFCNQRAISGVEKFEADSVIPLIEEALSTIPSDYEKEIAFFGGSFTGIERELMIKLLEIAEHYVRTERVSSIRCSTRPDYINEEIISILKKYSVKTVELGLQSCSDEVLRITKRGHSFDAEKKASKLILDAGIELVGQMMIGLPSSTEESEEKTADFIIQSGAQGARIYPTVVFYETELCEMALSGKYIPLSLDDAVIRSARVMRKFIDAGVKVIRVGLCASDNLLSDKTYYAGPNHPALGELVENRIFYDIIRDELIKKQYKHKVKIFVPKGSLSKAVGQKKANKIKLENEFFDLGITFSESTELSGYSISVIEERL